MADYYPPESRGKVFAILGIVGRTASLPLSLTAALMIDNLGWSGRRSRDRWGPRRRLRRRHPRGACGSRCGATWNAGPWAPTRTSPARRANRSRSARRGGRCGRSARCAGSSSPPSSPPPAASVYALLLPFLLVDQYGLRSATERFAALAPASFVAGLLGAFVGGSAGRPPRGRQPVAGPGRRRAVRARRRPRPSRDGDAAAAVAAGRLHRPARPSATPSSGRPPRRSRRRSSRRSVRTQGVQMLGLAAIPGLIFFVPMAGRSADQYGYGAAILFCVPFAVVGGAGQHGARRRSSTLDRRNAFAAAMAAEEWREAKAGRQRQAAGVPRRRRRIRRRPGAVRRRLRRRGGRDHRPARHQRRRQVDAAAGHQRHPGGVGRRHRLRRARHHPHAAARDRRPGASMHMPGGRGVFPGLTVRENILLANWLSRRRRGQHRPALREVFEIFPILRERADEAAASLSGGEQQMLSLAQAFLAEAAAADDRRTVARPVAGGGGPAPRRRAAIHARGMTIIVVEQSVNVALNARRAGRLHGEGRGPVLRRHRRPAARPDILRAVYVKGTGALTDRAPASARAGANASARALELGEARPVLEVENVTKRFGGVAAVDDVSFALREGEVLGVIGPNGSGKTTTLRPDQRVPAARRRSPSATRASTSPHWPPEARARRRLVRRFQDARLFPSLTVFETLLVALDQRLEVQQRRPVRRPACRRPAGPSDGCGPGPSG